MPDKKIIKHLKKIEPKQRLTNARYGGHKIVELNYPKGKYSKEDMEQLIKIQQQKYKSEPLMMMPTIRLKRGYRSVKAFSVDDDFHIDLYGEESDESEHFAIYIWKAFDNNGGSDEHNDCLFWAIVKSINKAEIKPSWATPKKFKKRLGLDRDDKVHISAMPEIEEALKININITGDHVYTSPHNNSKTANIKLVNGHYSYHSTKSQELIKTVPHKKQKILMAYESTNNVTVYSGESVETWSYEKYYEIKNNIFGDYCVVMCSNIDTIIEEYNEFHNNANVIKHKTDGLINYFECGGNHKNVALQLFYNFSKGVQDPESITELEEKWIKDAMIGGLIFGTKCNLKQAICYDMNSAYGYAMQFSGFKIPIKQGDFKCIDKLTDIVPFGIYRCNIKKSNDQNTNKLFRFNVHRKYTHIDIYVARKLGLQIDLINDGQANCLIYGAGKCINASKMFKTMIDYLYNLKCEKLTFAKRILTCLWGGLCEKKVISKTAFNPDQPYEIPADSELLGIRPTKKGDLILYAKRGKYFKTNYARMAPFLTAFVRKQMAYAIYPHKEHVHRCHTDSILSDVTISELDLSPAIGKWKIEHQGSCKIYNSMKVDWI